MKNTVMYCFLFVLIIELGFYQFIIKPVVEPLKLYGGHYYKALRPKKRKKLYRLRRDCHKMDIEASDDEADRRNSLLARKFLKIVDTDPQKEESRVVKLLDKKSNQRSDASPKAALTISKLSK